MALSHSSVALPTKAALICSEPAAALRLGRELVSHGLGGAKRIGTDLPALGGASDAASPTTSTEEDLASSLMTAMTELAFLEKRRRPDGIRFLAVFCLFADSLMCVALLVPEMDARSGARSHRTAFNIGLVRSPNHQK